MSRYFVSQAERSHKDFFKKNNNPSQRGLGPPVGCVRGSFNCNSGCSAVFGGGPLDQQ